MKENLEPGLSNTQAECTEEKTKIACLIDWVGFTLFPEDSSSSAVLRYFEHRFCIPLSAWQQGRKNYEGYANSVRFENINIYSEGQAGQGIHVDITGQGCRYLETLQGVQNEFSWKTLLSDVHSMNGKFTRIDIALDDFNRRFYIPDIFTKCLNGEITMKFQSWTPDGYFNADGKAKSGMTLYFGSDTSRFQICMYEKNRQMEVDEDWTRTELRFRKDRAEDIAKIITAQDEQGDYFYELGTICAGILKYYITFRDRSPTDMNKRRWKVSRFWEDFLKDVEPIKLASRFPIRSIPKKKVWLESQVSKTMFMSLLAYKGINDNWLREVLEEGRKKVKQEDIEIVNEFRRYNGRNEYKKDSIIKIESTVK